jgi:protein-arginine kinase
MTPEQVVANIKAIRASNPENLAARHFDEDFFCGLDDAMRDRLTKIIETGIENPDSQMGAYAMNADDYDLFASMLDPMIRDFHGIAAGTDIAQNQDWSTDATSGDLGAIDNSLKTVSMRVRVARNLSAFPLPGAMSKAQRLELEQIASQAFANLREDPAFGGRYMSLTPNSPDEIDESEYSRLQEAHQMFKDMRGDRYLGAAGINADWPHGRGMFVSRDEDFLVWVGEEDHLRIIAMQQAGDLNALFKRLRDGLEFLRGLLSDFAMSSRYGFVTSCPTNLGTGMRASLHMQLPNLTSHGRDLTRLKKQAKILGLDVRGVAGEHSNAGEDGLVDISPSARLGITEKEIMHELYDGAASLWAMEKV